MQAMRASKKAESELSADQPEQLFAREQREESKVNSPFLR